MKKRIANIIKNLLLMLATIFILFSGLILILQSRIIFHNVSDEESRIFLQGNPNFTEITFTAENGNTYHGMMYTSSNEVAPLIIYFGGNAEVSHRHMRMREIHGQWQYFVGFHYLFIDYKGYGLNAGHPHYSNIYEQALAVFDFAASLPSVDENRIIAMGFSLGTGSAVYLAANRPVAGLIIAAPFANGHDLFNNVLPIFRGPLGLLVRQRFPSDIHAPNVLSPVLVIASHHDEVIPFSSSKQLSQIFPGDVDFMVLYNARHNDIFQGDGVFDRVRSFLNQI